MTTLHVTESEANLLRYLLQKVAHVYRGAELKKNLPKGETHRILQLIDGYAENYAYIVLNEEDIQQIEKWNTNLY